MSGVVKFKEEKEKEVNKVVERGIEVLKLDKNYKLVEKEVIVDDLGVVREVE